MIDESVDFLLVLELHLCQLAVVAVPIRLDPALQICRAAITHAKSSNRPEQALRPRSKQFGHITFNLLCQGLGLSVSREQPLLALRCGFA